MKMTIHEARDICAKITIGQAYDLYLGPKNLAIESAKNLASCHINQIESCLAEVIMFSTLATIQVDPTLLGQVVILAQLFNAADEQTTAHLKAYCEKAHKFWLENKDNKSLLDAIQQSE